MKKHNLTDLLTNYEALEQLRVDFFGDALDEEDINYQLDDAIHNIALNLYNIFESELSYKIEKELRKRHL